MPYCFIAIDAGIADAWQAILKRIEIPTERVDSAAAALAFIAGIERLLDQRASAR